MPKSINLTEQELKSIISDSVKKVVKESRQNVYDTFLKPVCQKMVANLTDEEKKKLYYIVDNESWDVIYALLTAIKES